MLVRREIEIKKRKRVFNGVLGKGWGRAALINKEIGDILQSDEIIIDPAIAVSQS